MSSKRSTVDFSKVTPAHTYRGEDGAETRGARLLARRAAEYVASFAWCRRVREQYVGIAVPGVIGVILLRIEPARRGVDEWLWAVVGDLPPAYLVTDHAPNPACALDSYIAEMTCWVDAVRKGGSLEGVIPVNAPPTANNARDLASRLAFLDREILGRLRDDLSAG